MVVPLDNGIVEKIPAHLRMKIPSRQTKPIHTSLVFCLCLANNMNNTKQRQQYERDLFMTAKAVYFAISNNHDHSVAHRALVKDLVRSTFICYIAVLWYCYPAEENNIGVCVTMKYAWILFGHCGFCKIIIWDGNMLLLSVLYCSLFYWSLFCRYLTW